MNNSGGKTLLDYTLVIPKGRVSFYSRELKCVVHVKVRTMVATPEMAPHSDVGTGVVNEMRPIGVNYHCLTEVELPRRKKGELIHLHLPFLGRFAGKVNKVRRVWMQSMAESQPSVN